MNTLEKLLNFFEKHTIAVIALIVVAIVILSIFIIPWAMRNVSEMTVKEKLLNPRPDVYCLQLITSDGVAVSCWVEK